MEKSPKIYHCLNLKKGSILHSSCMENYCCWQIFVEKLLKWQFSHVFHSAASALHDCADKLHISNHFGQILAPSRTLVIKK